MIDVYLACVAGGLIVAFVDAEAFTEGGGDQWFALVIIFLWVFIESLLLATIGTTPGKWLLATKILPPAGTQMTFSIALTRSFKVWWRGLGLGVPVVSFFTQIVAHGKLTRGGVTTWDKEDGFIVIHERVGVIRTLVTVALFAAFVALMVLGNEA